MSDSSRPSVSLDPDSPAAFGAWLRGLRETQGALQRSLAAAADMDSSHLGKIERGDRLPTDEQAAAFARFLKADAIDLRLRLMTARLWRECDGDHALAHSVGGRLQEAAAPYLVNKPANKVRARK